MIKTENLSFNYKSLKVLENINLTIEKGKIYGLLGENGVGKTTLLTLLCGLKKPNTGSVSIDNYQPYKRQPHCMEKIYFLPNEFPILPLKSIIYAQEIGQFYPRFSLYKFQEIADFLEVNTLNKMTTYSSGQLKKINIALALACNTNYILMDEPTNELDIPSKTKFRSAITKFTNEDTAIVISTHQVRDLENIIDPIIILDSKSVLLNASVEDICHKLYFDYKGTKAGEVLYSEGVPSGSLRVLVNTDREDSKINLEALFNAVNTNKETVLNLFK